MKYSVFAVALQCGTTGERTFITFGENTTVKDIMTVLDEETPKKELWQVLGMSLLAAPSKNNLQEVISVWKKHFDA